MKRTPKTPALAKLAMLLLFAIATVAILDTTSISAQELGRTITSPFGVANPYMNASDASESGTDGDTFVDPETGEVGHIIRNPFGVANPEGVDTGIDIPDSEEEEVGGIITNPFGVPDPDGIDTGVDVFDEDEEYLISLPDDEESDVEESEDADEVDDETSDEGKELEEESAGTTTEKVLPVIDNPTRGVEYTIELSLTGSTGPAAEQYRVESTTGNIYAAPTLYVAPGGSFTLTVASTDNQTLVKENISFYFDGTHLDALSGVFENKLYLSGSSTLTSHTFRYNVSSNVYSGTHNVAVLYRYNNNVTIVRYLKIEIKAFSILVDSNNDGAINSKDEATKRNGKLIHINNLDVDKDGIPDFADGYYSNGAQLPDLNNYNSESLPFTPIKIRISNCIDMQNLGIFFFFNEASINLVYNWDIMNDFDGNLRLWAKDGNEIRMISSITDIWEPGDLIPSGYDNIIPLNMLNGVPVGEYIEYTLYLEAVKPCNSFNGIPVQAQIASNNGTVSSDYVMVTPYQIVFEGITSDKADENCNVLYNPCGVIKKDGENAEFHFDTIPSDIPCENIKWSASNLVFVGGRTGKNVTVHATGAIGKNFSLKIDIGRGNKYNPRINGKILDEKEVDLYIWIVADNTNGDNPEFSVSETISMIENVNDIFKQVAMKFKIAKIKYIKARQYINDNELYVLVDYRNVVNEHVAEKLVLYPQYTNFSRGEGLEVFFVRSLYDNIIGLSFYRNGIIVSKLSSSPFRTLAHEIGHACTLKDIYLSASPLNVLNSAINVNSLWIKEDCTYRAIPNDSTMSVAGYYRYDLKHVDLMKRLLMYGYTTDENSDISLGKVYGFNAQNELDDVKTGLKVDIEEYMDRTPKHDM